MIEVKPGVILGDSLAPAGARILEVVKQLAPGYSFPITITSARDGVHAGPNDPHYTGEAFDFRTRDLSPEAKRMFLANLQGRLGPRFFAFLENPGTPNEHIHVQRRKGTTYTVADYLQNA